MCVLPACMHVHKYFSMVDVVCAEASSPIPHCWVILGGHAIPKHHPGATESGQGWPYMVSKADNEHHGNFLV